MSNQTAFFFLAVACVIAFIGLVLYEERPSVRKKWQRPVNVADYPPTVNVVGYEVVAPVLAAAIVLADDRTEGELQRAQRFQIHRWEMQMALKEYAQRGGVLP